MGSKGLDDLRTFHDCSEGLWPRRCPRPGLAPRPAALPHDGSGEAGSRSAELLSDVLPDLYRGRLFLCIKTTSHLPA
ncbi:hypothetical protein IscW_ISCW017886, partial [Ixodes scapularis]